MGRVAEDPGFVGLVASSLPSGLLAVDAGGRIRHANAAARRVLRLPDADAVCGAPCREVLAAQPELAELLLSALGGGETRGRAELVLRSSEPEASGEVIGFTLASVRDAAGAVTGAAVLFRDLGLVERLEEAGRLQDRLAALGEMAAGLAHEIRNPLAGMKVTAELLERRIGADPDAAELLREIHDEIVSVEDTVDAALAFVKPLPMAQHSVDLVEVLEEAWTRVAARMSFAGRVERRYATPAPRVTGDPDQLRSVFANLLANACEAVAEQRDQGALRLEVATASADRSECPLHVPPVDHPEQPLHSRPADRSGRLLRVRPGERPEPAGPSLEAWVSVSDSGAGVVPEHRQKIFYPFFTTRDRGFGVGLATAHKIVVAHGGALELLEAPSGGATFRVRLALENAP
jgi:signal transduction histidine kinase